MTNAIHRTPCLETAEVKMLLNGPESFTPDGNFILGEAPELRNYFVCAGFNSAGIANSGGAGRLVAEWIVGGEAPSDLWDVDVRRFGAFTAQPPRLVAAHRRDAGPALRDALATPGTRERAAAAHVAAVRPAGRQGRRVRQQEQLGAGQLLQARWTVATRLRPGHARLAAVGAGRACAPRARRWRCTTRPRSASCWCRAATRLALLQRLCANEIDMPVGRMVYTAMLNERGGFESDLTVIAPGRASVSSSSPARPSRSATRTGSSATSTADEHVVVTDVSALYSVLSVMGPRARDLLARVSPDDLSPQALKFSHTREIDLGLARVRAARMSYVGGPGYEFYVPIEMARHVYLALHEAGADLGLVDAGYYALDALRIEAGPPRLGAETRARTRHPGRPGWPSPSSSTSHANSSAARPCCIHRASR